MPGSDRTLRLPEDFPRVLGPAVINPADLDPEFLRFLLPIARVVSPQYWRLLEERGLRLQEPQQYPVAAEAAAWDHDWTAEVPENLRWPTCEITFPADSERFTKGALNPDVTRFPGINLSRLQAMPDVEDSLAYWDGQRVFAGLRNMVRMLHGEFDLSPDERVVITPRVRGLGLVQRGVFDGMDIPATLFDVAYLAFHCDPSKMQGPLTLYIPKCQSAREGRFLAIMFQAIANALGWSREQRIRCFCLVEDFCLVAELAWFAYELRHHLVGFNLGRYDLNASFAHFHLDDPNAVIPDAPIPHTHPWFHAARVKMVEVCRRHGLIPVGGMTCWFPGSFDEALETAAVGNLREDKQVEFDAGCVRAWAGHPGQVEVIQQVFGQERTEKVAYVDLATHDIYPSAKDVGEYTVDGIWFAMETAVRYCIELLRGNGASLIPTRDGTRKYMEDRATFRIWTIKLAQHMRHAATVVLQDELEGMVWSESLHYFALTEIEAKLKQELAGKVDPQVIDEALNTVHWMVFNEHFDPV